MSAAEDVKVAPHVVLIDGRLYGSGATRDEAVADFRAQIAGATPGMRASMANRSTVVAVSDEHASDIAEMRYAPALAWGGDVCEDTAPVDDEQPLFLNHYDCACGASWSSEDECTCDDRCPECRTSCSPTWSEDA